jgi:hypothetical protein
MFLYHGDRRWIRYDRCLMVIILAIHSQILGFFRDECDFGSKTLDLLTQGDDEPE